MAVVGRERLPAIERHTALCSEGTISEDLLPFRLMNERMKNLTERIELETVENARHRDATQISLWEYGSPELPLILRAVAL